MAGGFMTEFGRNNIYPKYSVVILLTYFACNNTCPKDFSNFYDGFWLQKYLMIASKWNWLDILGQIW